MPLQDGPLPNSPQRNWISTFNAKNLQLTVPSQVVGCDKNGVAQTALVQGVTNPDKSLVVHCNARFAKQRRGFGPAVSFSIESGIKPVLLQQKPARTVSCWFVRIRIACRLLGERHSRPKISFVVLGVLKLIVLHGLRIAHRRNPRTSCPGKIDHLRIAG